MPSLSELVRKLNCLSCNKPSTDRLVGSARQGNISAVKRSQRYSNSPEFEVTYTSSFAEVALDWVQEKKISREQLRSALRRLSRRISRDGLWDDTGMQNVIKSILTNKKLPWDQPIDADGNTKFHYASKYVSDVQFFERFIEASCQRGEMDALLKNNNKNQSALHFAFQGRPGIAGSKLKILLNRGRFDLNQKDFEGRTQLHEACRTHSLEAIRVLLEWLPEVDVNSVDNENGTQNVNLSDNNGDTPLHIACQEGLAEGVVALLGHPAVKKNPLNNQKKTPLHLAVLPKQDSSLVQILVSDPEIEVDVQDCNGDTALHIACLKDRRWAVKLLWSDPRTNKFALNCDNETPISLFLRGVKRYSDQCANLVGIDTAVRLLECFSLSFPSACPRTAASREALSIISQRLKDNPEFLQLAKVVLGARDEAERWSWAREQARAEREAERREREAERRREERYLRNRRRLRNCRY